MQREGSQEGPSLKACMAGMCVWQGHCRDCCSTAHRVASDDRLGGVSGIGYTQAWSNCWFSCWSRC
jgi:hypothetical protein